MEPKTVADYCINCKHSGLTKIKDGKHKGFYEVLGESNLGKCLQCLFETIATWEVKPKGFEVPT